MCLIYTSARHIGCWQNGKEIENGLRYSWCVPAPHRELAGKTLSTNTARAASYSDLTADLPSTSQRRKPRRGFLHCTALKPAGYPSAPLAAKRANCDALAIVLVALAERTDASPASTRLYPCLASQSSARQTSCGCCLSICRSRWRIVHAIRSR